MQHMQHSANEFFRMGLTKTWS